MPRPHVGSNVASTPRPARVGKVGRVGKLCPHTAGSPVLLPVGPSLDGGAGALIAVAFALPRAPRATVPTPAPSPWLVGILSFALASLFMLATMGFDRLGAWLVVGLYVLLDAIAIVFILRWSRQADWGAAHVLALAGGALLTYAWHAFPQTPVLGATSQLDLIGNAMFAIGAVALLAAAARVTGNGRHQLSVAPTRGTMPL